MDLSRNSVTPVICECLTSACAVVQRLAQEASDIIPTKGTSKIDSHIRKACVEKIVHLYWYLYTCICLNTIHIHTHRNILQHTVLVMDWHWRNHSTGTSKIRPSTTKPAHPVQHLFSFLACLDMLPGIYSAGTHQPTFLCPLQRNHCFFHCLLSRTNVHQYCYH